MDDRQSCFPAQPLTQHPNEDTNQCKVFELPKERENQHIHHTLTHVHSSPSAGRALEQWSSWINAGWDGAGTGYEVPLPSLGGR